MLFLFENFISLILNVILPILTISPGFNLYLFAFLSITDDLKTNQGLLGDIKFDSSNLYGFANISKSTPLLLFLVVIWNNKSFFLFIFSGEDITVLFSLYINEEFLISRTLEFKLLLS